MWPKLSGEIRVAAGTYTGVSTRDGLTQMVYLSKTVMLLGGYSTSNWNAAYPLTQTATLDAQGQGRVIYVADGSPLVNGLRLTGGDTSSLGPMDSKWRRSLSRLWDHRDHSQLPH